MRIGFGQHKTAPWSNLEVDSVSCEEPFRAPFAELPPGAHLLCYQITVLEVVQSITLWVPPWLRSSISGHLPSRLEPGKRDDVHLRLATLGGNVRNAPAIRREDRTGLKGRTVRDGNCILAVYRNHPDVGGIGRSIVIGCEPAAVGRPRREVNVPRPSPDQLRLGPALDAFDEKAPCRACLRR